MAHDHPGKRRNVNTSERQNVTEEGSRGLTMRWTYRQEMRYLFELAGFEIEAEFCDYIESPPAYGKEQLWVAPTVSGSAPRR